MAAAVATLQPQATKVTEGNNADSGESVESNTDTEEGATPLMYATQQGRDNIVQQMLNAEAGCALARDRTGKTALHYCCEQAGPSTAALLLAAAPALLDARDQDGYAPLTLAVIAGNRTLVRYLLARGADVNTADTEQHSVVHWATVCGDAASLELVVGAGATVSTPDLHGGYPIHYAAQLCGPQGAAATACTDSANGATVSRSVTDRGAGLAVLRTLLAAGASVSVRDHDGRQPLLWAASAGSADAILALINAGADIEAEDKDGLTALHCAASRGHTDCVETLVSLCGAHVDVIDSNGCTALFYAVTLGHADATRLLLRRGAEPNRQDRKGRTAAHCGAAKGQLETLRILSAHGANLWLRNVRGDFPLHDAVQSGRSDLVRWLLSFKQSSNQSSAADATNNDGRTPLHVAALHNNIEICKILLDARCLLNPTMRTNRHQLLTPLDAALLRGNRGCAKFLQLHGGVPASRLTENLGRLRATGRSPPLKQVENCSPEPSPPDRSSAQMDLQSRTIQVHMKDDILQVGAPVVVCHHVTRSAPGSDGDCGQCGQHCCTRSVRRRTQTDVQRWRRRERQAKRREARLRDTSQNSSCSDKDEFQGRSEKDSTQKSTLSDGDSPMRIRKGSSFVQVGEGDFMRYSDGEAVHQNRRRSERTTREGASARKPRRHEKRSRSSRSNENLDESHNKHRESTKSTRIKDVKESSDREQLKQEDRKSRSESKSRDSSRKRRAKSSERSASKTSSKTTEHVRKIEENAKKSNAHSSQGDVEIRSKTILNVEKSVKSDEVKSGVKDMENSSLTKRYSTDDGADSTPMHNVSTKTVVTAVVHRENVRSSSASSEEGTEEKVNEQSPSSSTQETEADVNKGASKTNIVEEKLGECGTLTGKEEQVSKEKERKGKEERSERRGQEEKEEQFKNEERAEHKKKEEIKEYKKREEIGKHTGTEDHNVNNVQEDHKRKTKNEEFVTEEVQEDIIGKEEIRKKGQESITLEADSKTESMEGHGKEKVEVVPVEESPEKQGACKNEQRRPVNEEFKGPIEKADVVNNPPSKTAQTLTSVDQSPVTKLVFKDRQVSTRHKVDDRAEKRLNRTGEVNRYGATNLRKEKMNNVRQVKKIVTSKSSYSVSSKKHTGKVAGKIKEAPAFTIDVDDEFSGRSPNDQFVDSGLEPSPRRETDKEGRSFNTASLEEETSDPEQRKEFQERIGQYDAEGKSCNDEEISVTRAVQMSMRKYHLERRIFHELLELKRLQIRAGRANEQVLVKRLVDDYRRAGLIVGLQQYSGTYTFRSFEKYLYEQLRALQATGQHVVPRLQSSDDLERLTAALRRTRARHGSPPDDPLLCTLSTHRCHHALHAYSGVPCAAYIPRLNHHTIPKEDLENPGAHAHAHATPRNRTNVSFLPLIEGRHTEIGRFSRLVDSSRPVTLQLSHGHEKQVISLPTERLDKHKRYYVTFTIKGGPPASGEINAQEETSEAAPAEGEAAPANSSRLSKSQSVPPKTSRHGKSF